MRFPALIGLLALAGVFAVARPAAAADAKAPRVVQMSVTGDGFVPAEIKVKKGEPLQLVITRKTEKTCATEIVVKDYGINTPLPLNKAVTVNLVPKKEGKVRFACGMDMIAGYLVVE